MWFPNFQLNQEDAVTQVGFAAIMYDALSAERAVSRPNSEGLQLFVLCDLRQTLRHDAHFTSAVKNLRRK